MGQHLNIEFNFIGQSKISNWCITKVHILQRHKSFWNSKFFIHLLTRTFNLCNLVKQLLHLLHLLTYLPTSFQSLDRYISLKSVLFFVFIYWLHIQQAYSICDKQYMPMLFLNFISQWTIGGICTKSFLAEIGIWLTIWNCILYPFCNIYYTWWYSYKLKIKQCIHHFTKKVY